MATEQEKKQASILACWQVTDQGYCIPLDKDELLKRFDRVKIKGYSSCDLWSNLYRGKVIEMDDHGKYSLSKVSVKMYQDFVKKGLIKAPYVPTNEQSSEAEWQRFRNLLRYYIDCVPFQEDRTERLYESDLYKSFFFPNIGAYDWLCPLDSNHRSIPVDFDVTERERFIATRLTLAQDNDSDLFLGYPLEQFKTKKGEVAFSPIFLIPVKIKKPSSDRLSIEVMQDKADINQEWAEYNLGQEKNAFLRTVYKMHEQDDFRGCLDAFLTLPQIEVIYRQQNEVLNIHKLNQYIEHSTKSKALVNSAALFIGQDLKYNKNVTSELEHISGVPAEILDTTALAYIFREHPKVPVETKRTFVPLQFIPMNRLQDDAVRDALANPVSKVTGPPGTGKSQVAVNLIANLVYQGQSVLFTSMNHKAVHAIEERAFDVSTNIGYDLINYCQNADGKNPFPWFNHKIDDLIGRAKSQHIEIGNSEIENIDTNFKFIRKSEQDLEALGNIYDEMLKNQREIEECEKDLQKISKYEPSISLSDDLYLKIEQEMAQLSDCLTQKYSLQYLFWLFFKKKKHEQSLEFFQEHFPNICSIYEATTDLKSFFGPILKAWHGSNDRKKLLQELDSKTKDLPKEREIFSKIKNLKGENDKSKFEALKYKMTQEILEFSADQQRVNDLGNSISFFKNSKNPFIQYIMDKEDSEIALNKIRDFTSLFPAWATTMQSLPKASPCLPGYFDHLIIDEASQCSIPPIIPALFRAKYVTVIGDPKQFPPVFAMNEVQDGYFCAKHRIGNQLDDQRFKFYGNTAYSVLPYTIQPIMLREHFRCNASIMDFINETFYDGELQHCTNDEKFVDIQKVYCGNHAIEWIEASSIEEEYDEVKKRVLDIVEKGFLRKEIEIKDSKGNVKTFDNNRRIGVITVTKKDSEELQSQLNTVINQYKVKDKNDESRIIVNTSNGFQGGDCDVIFFMLGYQNDIKSNMKWYFSDESHSYIYNVAASRAKACLFIIGNRELCRYSGIKPLEKLAEYPKPPRPITHEIDGIFDSIWEKNLYNELLAKGIKTKPQYHLLNRRLDLAFIDGDFRLDIEVDGDKYHTNQITGLRKMDDLYRDEQIESAGWYVIRFRVRELENDMPACIAKIKECISNRKVTP